MGDLGFASPLTCEKKKVTPSVRRKKTYGIRNMVPISEKNIVSQWVNTLGKSGAKL